VLLNDAGFPGGQVTLLRPMPVDLQPTLRGDLLHLRPLRPDDFEDLYAVASDPLIWEQHPNPDRCKEEVFRDFFRDALDSRGALIAIDNKTNRVIGSSRFHDFDEQKSQLEIGWTFLARSHWGGAYNAEMKQLMLRHAFGFVKSVIFVVGPRNIRSQRALARIGAIFDGNLTYNGQERVVYRINAGTSAESPG
jgi:N-acetyltransferase